MFKSIVVCTAGFDPNEVGPEHQEKIDKALSLAHNDLNGDPEIISNDTSLKCTVERNFGDEATKSTVLTTIIYR